MNNPIISMFDTIRNVQLQTFGIINQCRTLAMYKETEVVNIQLLY